MNINLESAVDFLKQHPKLVAAEDYELTCQRSQNRFSHFKNGESISESRNSFGWVQIRVLLRKRLGVATTVFCNEKDLNSMIDKAFELAEHTAVDPWFRFPLWKPEASIGKDQTLESTTEVSAEPNFFESLFSRLTIQPVGLEERYLEQQDSRIITRKTEKLIRSNSGRFQRFQLGVVNQGMSGFYRIEESRGFSHPFKSKEPFLEALMRRSNRLTQAKTVNSAPSGKYILNGLVVTTLLKSIEALLNGSSAVIGKSKASQWIGRQIFSDKVSIVDNGLYLGGEGYQEFDFEGSSSQETRLIENGILKTFFHDASSAARYNRASTANLVLNENNIPAVGITNCYLLPSNHSLRDLFKEMEDGIYLECLDKWGKELTRDGKLGLLGHGWRVEKGEPVEPLSQLFITVDPVEIFKEVTLVANDLEFWGRYGAPSVFLEKMPLSDI